MHVRELLTFCRYDIDWLEVAVPYLLVRRHAPMPPQPRFNTGEWFNARWYHGRERAIWLWKQQKGGGEEQ